MKPTQHCYQLYPNKKFKNFLKKNKSKKIRKKKISEPKSWFFEKTKLINLYPHSSRKKESAQINKIRNEKVIVITDTIERQRPIRHDYKQLYPKKMDDLDKVDKFLET